MQATAVAIHALENIRTHYIIFNEQNLMQSPEPILPLRSIFIPRQRQLAAAGMSPNHIHELMSLI